MTPEEFELILEEAVFVLTKDLTFGEQYRDQRIFEDRVREVLTEIMEGQSKRPLPSRGEHDFPDISINGFGVEVKYTASNSWAGTGNSVFEGERDPTVTKVYLVYGKAGGEPEVRWDRYENCIIHVRISHAPRFNISLTEPRRESLFSQLGISYNDFRLLSPSEKMKHVRDYARGRLAEGERLWWLEDSDEPEHTLPIEVRLYMKLPDSEKRRMRAEAAILCPQICKPSRARNKYTDAALYLLTQHGVFCPQTRDLFTAGSVAGPKRGGNYLLRGLQDIQGLMHDAAEYLDNALFEEYWGTSYPPDVRIAEWLKRADNFARDWKPSDHLFTDN